MKTIELKDVKLEVPLSEHSYSIKRFLLHKKSSSDHTTILNISSFVAKKGDKICVIGRNGQGKTTFMKIVAGIYLPSSGYIKVKYKPTTVLAAGIGLEDDLTVEKNIQLALTLKNLAPKKMKDAFDAILEFSELQDSRQKLFKHLSTGYKSRLAFAIAISEDPKILVLDEVLGGGDEFFMKKATVRLKESIVQSETALIATHAPDGLQDVCNRLLIIDKGTLIYDGNFEEGVEHYRSIYE